MSGFASKRKAEGELIPRGKRKLLLVEWEDASGPTDSGWRFADSVKHDPFLCRSIGWLVREGPKHLTLAAHVGNISEVEADEQICGYMHIPRAMIRRQAVLTVPTWAKEQP